MSPAQSHKDATCDVPCVNASFTQHRNSRASSPRQIKLVPILLGINQRPNRVSHPAPISLRRESCARISLRARKTDAAASDDNRCGDRVCEETQRACAPSPEITHVKRRTCSSQNRVSKEQAFLFSMFPCCPRPWRWTVIWQGASHG